MDALQALHCRVSTNRLTAPAPSKAVLKNIQKAALRAADHGRLKPWRFLIVETDGLDSLGELFVAASGPDLSESEKLKIIKKSHRAPMVIVAIAKPVDLPKIPEIEQIISTGAAVQNMLNAAYAQNIGAMWRTGGLAYNPEVKRGLGLAECESIVGFLYLGTPQAGKSRCAPEVDVEDYFLSWPQEPVD